MTSSGGWKSPVALVTRNGEQTFRIMVWHYHTRPCQGFLYISPTHVAYDPVFTPGFKEDAFDVSRQSLRNLKFDTARGGVRVPDVEFETPARPYTFVFLFQGGPDQRAYLGNGREALIPAAQDWVKGALLDFAKTKSTFEGATSDVRSR